VKYKCQCGEVIDIGADHYCRAYPNKLLARIDELEAEVIQYMAGLDRVLEAHKKAVTRLIEWNPELAQDFVTLLLMDLQKKEEK
jgi:hypothetical protein